MQSHARLLLTAITIIMVLSLSSVSWAQHKHGAQKKIHPVITKIDKGMSMMMNSPHHDLMTAYMTSMSAFASSLREQSMKPKGMDVELARGTVGELRHNLNAMEALHQRHTQSMSSEMQAKMKVMMDEMEKKCAEMKGLVVALETDVQNDKPDPAQVTTHANELLKHFGMMSKMHGGRKAALPQMNMKKM